MTDHVDAGVRAAGNKAPSDGQRMSDPDARDPGRPPKPERTQEYQRQARHLLMELEPIAVSGTPEAAGEYDCMIGPLLHRLSRGTASITPASSPVSPPS